MLYNWRKNQQCFQSKTIKHSTLVWKEGSKTGTNSEMSNLEYLIYALLKMLFDIWIFCGWKSCIIVTSRIRSCGFSYGRESQSTDQARWEAEHPLWHHQVDSKENSGFGFGTYFHLRFWSALLVSTILFLISVLVYINMHAVFIICTYIKQKTHNINM